MRANCFLVLNVSILIATTSAFFQLINNHQTSLTDSAVILVPGFASSRLEAKTVVLDKLCPKFHEKWQPLWFNLRLMLGNKIDCFVKMVQLRFDPKTKTTTSRRLGTLVRVHNDKIDDVRYLSNLRLPQLEIFDRDIHILKNHLHLHPDIDFKAIPYDFRKAPNELGELFDTIRESIEKNMALKGHRKTTLICHSMGCRYLLHFLQQQSREWKHKHIKRLISMAAPWAGSVAVVSRILTGVDLGVGCLIDATKVANAIKTFPSSYILFPRSEVYEIDRPLVKIHGTDQEFTLKNLRDLFKLREDHEAVQLYDLARGMLGTLKAPEVEVWCFIGTGHDTIIGVELSSIKSNRISEITDRTFMDGDRTVDKNSASYCKKWAKEQRQPVYFKSFKESHQAMTANKEVGSLIQSIISEQISPSYKQDLLVN